MKKKILRLAQLGVALCLLASTVHANPSGEQSNTFGLKLLSQTRRLENGQLNTLISPLSTYVALSMVANGAVNQTEQEILTTLENPGITRDQLNSLNQTLLSDIKSTYGDYDLELVDSLWTDQSYHILPSFASSVSQNYGANAESLDFALPTSLTTINQWIADKTHGLIPKMLQSLTSSVYLVNTTYFKGSWTIPFIKERTNTQNFTRADGTTVSASMMHQEEGHQYIDVDNLKVVSLSFGPTGQTRMLFILPTSVADLEQKLNATEVQSLVTQLDSAPEHFLNLSLPKFNFSDNTDLIPSLEAMGMHTAFVDGMAQFNDIAPGFYLQQALQSSVISVDENGTTAAAATVMGGGTSIAPENPIDLTFDHPFGLAIQETKSGAILFLGIVGDPTVGN